VFSAKQLQSDSNRISKKLKIPFITAEIDFVGLNKAQAFKVGDFYLILNA
jgi:hypothetical protein